MVRHNSYSSLVAAVKSKKHFDAILIELKETVHSKSNESFSQKEDGLLRHQRILCKPDVDTLRESMIEESHGSRYSIHPGGTRMYHIL